MKVNKWSILLFLSLMLFISSLYNFLMTLSLHSSCPQVIRNVQSPPKQYDRLSHAARQTLPDPFQQYKLDKDCSIHDDAVVRYICEVEAATVFFSPHPNPTVIAKDLSILRYYAQRDLPGWSYAYKNITFDITEYSFRKSVKLSELSVLLCLGITSQDKHCLKSLAYKYLSQGQRINQVYHLRDVLWRKDAFCYTLKEALRGYKGWNNFTFPCWVLPHDKDLLKEEMQAKKGNYIVKPAFRGEGHGIFVVDSFEEIDGPSLDNYVVQPFLNNPFLVHGKKFDLRTYVLVTSVLPLRLYIYSEGLVRFASSKYDGNATRGGKEQQYLTNTSVGKKFTKLANLTWTFKKLSTYFEKNGINATKVFAAVHNAITRTILSSEFRFLSNSRSNLGGYSCKHCFQLLGVDVILDNHLHPIVIEVNGLPSMQLTQELGEPPNPSSVYTQTKYGLMRDMLHIIYGNISVAKDVARILHHLKVGAGLGIHCNSSTHVHCLDLRMLEQVIVLRREHLIKGDYINLYPIHSGDHFSKFIKHMNKISLKKLNNNGYRTLWQIHHLFTVIAKLHFD